ncbi:hypothetical protein DD509_02795 [Dehalogenimonas alkenigignens]|nr:hypothetical protein DD509_02795 [Dehalogenimonas alkenigignens]
MKRSGIFTLVSLVLFFTLPCIRLEAQDTVVTGETAPLTITDVTANNITTSAATITWETNSNTTSQVFFDTILHPDVADYRFATTLDTNHVTMHTVSLNGLTSSTTYHYRVKSDLPDTTLSVISDDYTFTTTQASGGGGGGGGGGFGSQLVGIGLAGTSPWMDGNGKAITAGTVATPDGTLTLNIPIGTFVWNAAGAAQPFLSAVPLADPPASPDKNILVFAYEMGPTGVTFNPAISMTFKYTDAQVPPGTREVDLVIAWWNGSQWVMLTGVVDTEANTVTASVSHFTAFALFAPAPPPPPPPTLKINTPAAGASFEAGTVSVSISAGNLKLISGQSANIPGEGRAIYYLDVSIPTAPGQSALTAPGTYVESALTSYTWNNLAPGTHTIGVQLVQNDRTPFNPPVYASVSVTIAQPPPPTTTAAIPIPTATVGPTPGPGFDWTIPIIFIVAALALGGFLYWRLRRPVGLKYTNR